ncbi:hypothetical protein [Alternaria alternata polymycovirus 1]|nr:hypothetical protein [Alternaria alternata polymycovirus 1]
MQHSVSFQLSPSVAHEAISAINDRDFDAMMAIVMSEPDPQGTMAALTKGHITEKYAVFFSDFAPLPVVVDPWVDLTQGDEFLDLIGIDRDDAELLEDDYVQHPGASDTMVSIAVSETIEKTFGGLETKLVFDGDSLCGYAPNPKPFRHPDMPQTTVERFSKPDPEIGKHAVPMFELLPGTGMAYGAIVDSDTIVVGRTPEITIARARTDYNCGPQSDSRAITFGRVDENERIIFMFSPDKPGSRRVPNGDPVGLEDYVTFVRRTVVMTALKIHNPPVDVVPPS